MSQTYRTYNHDRLLYIIVEKCQSKGCTFGWGSSLQLNSRYQNPDNQVIYYSDKKKRFSYVLLKCSLLPKFVILTPHRRIQNPVKYLRQSVLRKQLTAKSHKCLRQFYIIMVIEDFSTASFCSMYTLRCYFKAYVISVVIMKIDHVKLFLNFIFISSSNCFYYSCFRNSIYVRSTTALLFWTELEFFCYIQSNYYPEIRHLSFSCDIIFPISNPNPAGNYMFKVNNRNTGAMCEICSKLIIKTPEQRC